MTDTRIFGSICNVRRGRGMDGRTDGRAPAYYDRFATSTKRGTWINEPNTNRTISSNREGIRISGSQNKYSDTTVMTKYSNILIFRSSPNVNKVQDFRLWGFSFFRIQICVFLGCKCTKPFKFMFIHQNKSDSVFEETMQSNSKIEALHGPERLLSVLLGCKFKTPKKQKTKSKLSQILPNQLSILLLYWRQDCFLEFLASLNLCFWESPALSSTG